MTFAFRMWYNLRPGRAAREKLRKSDGEVGDWSVFMFGALKVVASACVD
jgi:hypothetical protein